MSLLMLFPTRLHTLLSNHRKSSSVKGLKYCSMSFQNWSVGVWFTGFVIFVKSPSNPSSPGPGMSADPSSVVERLWTAARPLLDFLYCAGVCFFLAGWTCEMGKQGNREV